MIRLGGIITLKPLKEKVNTFDKPAAEEPKKAEPKAEPKPPKESKSTRLMQMIK